MSSQDLFKGFRVSFSHSKIFLKNFLFFWPLHDVKPKKERSLV